ncbi:MAG: metallophosphoesterase [Fibrobacter sp.]|nr:metallophosphoesterase [Fibrobacter sp.]
MKHLISLPLLLSLFLLTCSPSTPPFSFIFCNDIHLGCGPDDPENLSAALKKMKHENNSDFIVLAGDLTCNATIHQFRTLDSLLKKSGMQFFLLPGNHDIDCVGNDDRKNYTSHFSESAQSYLFIHKGICFLMLDLSDCAMAHVKVDSTHLNWIKSSLERVDPQIPLVIITHFPLHPGTPRFAVANSSSLISALLGRKILGYFSGHFHDSYRDTIDNVPFFSNVTLLPNIENMGQDTRKGYLRVFVRSLKISAEFMETH